MFGKRGRNDASKGTSRTVTDTNEQHPGGLTRDHVVWAYRLLLDRDPENDAVIGPKLAGSRNTAELRHHLMTSAEFQQNNPDYAHTNDRTIVIKELPGGVRLFIDLSDHVIGLNILRGRYEEEGVEFVRRTLNAGDIAVDAGAHVGFFTVQMAAMVGSTGHVYAFEPLDSNADLLERSIAENRFADRIVFRRSALGASSGTATLTFPDETLNSGGAYLLREGDRPLMGNRTQRIPVAALDDLGLQRPVRLIKMDVEGAEPQVIKGAARLMAEDRPVVLSELHHTQLERASGTTCGAFLAEMRALGYRAHALEGAALGPPIESPPADAIASVAFIPK